MAKKKKYKLVITSVRKARARRKELKNIHCDRLEEQLKARGFLKTKEQKAAAKLYRTKKVLEATAEKLKVGDIWTIGSLECPLELPNCRNCGDPDFADSCQEAGHCADCGTKHGCGPDSVLKHSGVELEEITDGA